MHKFIRTGTGLVVGLHFVKFVMPYVFNDNLNVCLSNALKVNY